MRRPALSLLALVLAATAARSAFARPDPARVDAAVTKGAAWVKSRQLPDGSWRDKWAHAYPMGETAISLLTLLKCGVSQEDAALNRGFDWMLAQPFTKTYDVSIAILAVEARFSPKPAPPDAKNPFRTIVRKAFQKGANGAVKDWLERATAFLLANQHGSGLWNYPGQDEDVSNTQFALLALKSAHRMGVRVGPEPWLGSLEYLLANQEKAGSKIAPFEVPAADGPIDDVEDRKARAAQRAAAAGAAGGKDGTQSHAKTGGSMEARGWGYKPSTVPRGSMTAAGVACLVIIKSELEGNVRYEKSLAPGVERAIRDGCAWLAYRFMADKNPGADQDWLFYYLYTLERAGTLSGCELLGTHDWYSEGAEVILKAQKDDGHFEEGTKGELDGALAGSCLALLFLKRATVPVIERTATGVPEGAAANAPRLPRAGVSVEKLADGNCAVTFRFKASAAATKVSVAGSWNNWDKDATPCASSPDGTFEATVRMKPGKITYKFVVNGQDWQTDPGNPELEDDGHGNKNSVFTVG